MASTHISLLVHFIWSTAGRQAWIDPEWQDRLYGFLGGVPRNKNAKLLCAGGTRDHVHLYTSLPATLSLAQTANALKANSSRWIHETFPHRKMFAWQKGYAAFSVCKSAEDRLVSYVRDQETHHRVRTFQEEFVEFLEKHGLDYDERYLWD